MQTNMDGGADIYINTTAVCDNDPESYPEEGCIFPPANYDYGNTHITSQGDGWYKFETIYFATSGGGLLDNYVEIVYPASVQIDNITIEKINFDLNVSAISPNNVQILSGKRAGVPFTYGIQSSLPVDNCTMWISQESPYLSGNWGAWMKVATASMLHQNSTNVIPFVFASGRNDQNYAWKMTCMSEGLSAESNIPVFTVLDAQKSRGMTHTILELAPILLAFFAVGMTFVWVMTREGEDMLSVMIHMFIIYLVVVVMLLIIYSMV